MSVVFRLVHLSDLHFAANPNRLPAPIQTGGLTALFNAAVTGHRGNWFKPASQSTRAARAVARYLATNVFPEDSPDVVVISGDLATTGSLRDLESARAYLSGDGKEWVNADQEPRLFSPVRLCVLPGNHDRYHKGTLLPGATTFDEVFSEFWSVSPNCNRVSQPVCIDKGGESLAIICADFTFRSVVDALQTVTGYIGRGRVYGDVLAELVAQTGAVRKKITPEAAVIWVVHYPPQFPGVNPNLALQDEEELLQSASDAGIRFLLAGHTHIDRIYAIDQITVSCVGSATQADLDSVWHFSLNELHVDNGTVVRLGVTPFRYEKARNNFVRGSVVFFNKTKPC